MTAAAVADAEEDGSSTISVKDLLTPLPPLPSRGDTEGEGGVLLPSSSSSSPIKQIHWSTIEIREYPIIIGDNPSVLRGVPLTIDWDPISTIILDLNEYETQKIPRKLVEIIMSAADRQDLLLNRVRRGGGSRGPPYNDDDDDHHPTQHYTMKMLRDAQQSVVTARDQRRQTNQARRFDPQHEFFEKISRKVQRFIGVRPSKRSEQEYLNLHCKGGGGGGGGGGRRQQEQSEEQPRKRGGMKTGRPTTTTTTTMMTTSSFSPSSSSGTTGTGFFQLTIFFHDQGSPPIE